MAQRAGAHDTSGDGLDERHYDFSNGFAGLIPVVALWVRPVWYAAILVWIAIQPIAMWQRGVVSVFAAVYAASNILMLTPSDDPNWSRIVERTLQIELVCSIVAALFFPPFLPKSPAPLLIWPTLTTFLMQQRGTSRGLAIGVLAAVTSFILDFRAPIWFPAAVNANPSYAKGTLSSALLLGLYLTLGLAIFMVALLLRQQGVQTSQLRRTMNELQQKSQELSHRNDQLNEFADKVYELAATEERNRIASEIHDTVAHRLTALFVQLQAAERQLGQGKVETAVENLQISEELTRESLEAVRESVRSIRRTSASEGLNALHRLTAQYAALTGMAINTTFEEPLQGIPPVVLALLYRVIQEGLTNAKRHGRASEVSVRLSRRGLILLLEVRDNGRGAGETVFGFGLSTMSEKVESLGGQLSIQTEPGQGFTLQLRVPAWEVDS